MLGDGCGPRLVAFELDRRPHAEGAVEATGVVPALDEPEDVGVRGLVGHEEADDAEELDLEGGEDLGANQNRAEPAHQNWAMGPS
jgi:hypothetical protein